MGQKQPKPQTSQASTKIPAPIKKKPQFKAYETDAAYHILGSLPEGVDKKSINLKFLDSNTLGISGCILTPQQPEVQNQSEDSDSEASDTDTDTDSESESESEIESEVESEDESETKTDRRSLQPYVEDIPDIDDPRTPAALASLQMRRGSSSSSRSSASPSSSSSCPEKPAQPNNAAKLNAKAMSFKPQPTQTKKKIPTQKPEVKKEDKKQMVTERFERKFQFPRPVEMKGVKARLEGGQLEVMVPKKRVVRSPGLPGMWWV
jgi:HSP20 family molecular chaperone IbpA